MERLFREIRFTLTIDEIVKCLTYYERDLPTVRIPLYWDFGTIH